MSRNLRFGSRSSTRLLSFSLEQPIGSYYT